MKFLIALLAAAAAGILVLGLSAAARTMTLPKGNVATQGMRRLAERLIELDLPLVSAYLRHIQPILVEIPLPAALDLPSFIALHLAAGLPLWIVGAVALPDTAMWLLPIC